MQLNEIAMLSPDSSSSSFEQIYPTLLDVIELYAVEQLLRAVRRSMKFGPRY